MKHFFKSTSKLLVATSLVMSLGASSLMAEVKDKFEVSWTIYVGWMPWDYAQQQGIVDKWAKKYNIEIDLVQVNVQIVRQSLGIGMNESLSWTYHTIAIQVNVLQVVTAAAATQTTI